MSKTELAVVCGAGGFIGGHLVAHLRALGVARIRAVDIKPVAKWYQRFDDVENVVADLQEIAACRRALKGASHVYNLAADMGGMGFIEHNKALCMLSVLINTHLLMTAREEKTKNFFFASSACVYNADKQKTPQVTPLKEPDAYPALPEDGYGWEKLFSERMCRHFREDFGLRTRMARFHNVYGPFGTFEGGREKAPAAMCRKVIECKLSGNLEIGIWGDGNQTRSFMYVDDCVNGIVKIDEGDFVDPINLGSNELVSINQLVGIVEDIAGVSLKRRYQLDAPRGVNGRNSDNTLIQEQFGWQPSISLADGIEKTYRWIYDEIAPRYGACSSILIPENPSSVTSPSAKPAQEKGKPEITGSVEGKNASR